MKKLFLLTIAVVAVAATILAKDVNVEWDPNPETNIGGYKVYVGTNGTRNYTNSAVILNGTKAVIVNVPIGVRHWIAVTAFDTNGLESEFSEEVSFIVPNKPGKPRVR